MLFRKLGCPKHQAIAPAKLSPRVLLYVSPTQSYLLMCTAGWASETAVSSFSAAWGESGHQKFSNIGLYRIAAMTPCLSSRVSALPAVGLHATPHSSQWRQTYCVSACSPERCQWIVIDEAVKDFVHEINY